MARGTKVAGAALVILVLGAVGAWAVTRQPTGTACTLAATVDETGSATPAAARQRILGDGSTTGVDPASPMRVDEDGDEVTADYALDEALRGVVEPGREAFYRVVTERDDGGTWRVTSANRCERGPV